MKFETLKCVDINVNLNDYLHLYDYIRNSMSHPNWLGTFEKNKIMDILSNGGKIWIFYNGNQAVCSMFYIPANNASLKKHNVFFDENITGSLGPIMVSPEYTGNGYQSKMMKKLENYCKSIGKKYIFTKAHCDNIYSINNMLKNGYEMVHEYKNERGNMCAFIKEL